MTRARTPWLGLNSKPTTRPVKNENPTPKQIAETVLQELQDPGYIVSFHDSDVIDTEQALRILSEAILSKEGA